MAVLNWDVVVVPVIVRNSVPFCRIRPVPVRPATVTPMAWVPVVHVTTTVVTLAVAVPLPPDTVKLLDGAVGGWGNPTNEGLVGPTPGLYIKALITENDAQHGPDICIVPAR